jgi:2-polyprenyl-3-methyl-5-hydroxy-6-metoxy-1,4-benzoquinol methylase
MVFTDPPPTPEEVRMFYAEEYRSSYKGVDVPKGKHILRAGRVAKLRMERIKQYLHSGMHLFDVGSGGGEFVYLCNRVGLAARGVEPNKGYCTFSQREYGIDVQQGFFQDVEIPTDTLDCITMFHVLEHLEQPVQAIEQLAQLLRPGGLMVIEVPNVDYQGWAPSSRWHIGHLFNFSRQTLAAVGMKAGLDVLSCAPIDDGGSLFAVLKKGDAKDYASSAEEAASSVLAGSFDSTYSILQNHTTLGHYCRIHKPLLRLFKRVLSNAEEINLAKKYDRPKALLDDLFQDVGELPGKDLTVKSVVIP